MAIGTLSFWVGSQMVRRRSVTPVSSRFDSYPSLQFQHHFSTRKYRRIMDSIQHTNRAGEQVEQRCGFLFRVWKIVKKVIRLLADFLCTKKLTVLVTQEN